MAQGNPNRPAKPGTPGAQVKRKSSVGWCILWFFIGMLIPIGAIGIVVGVVPIGTITSMLLPGQTVVSDNLASKSLVSILTGINDITIGDIPYLETAVNNALSGTNGGFAKYVTIDWASLQNVAFTDPNLSSILGSALTFNVSIENLEADNLVTIDPNLKKMPCFSPGNWVAVEDVDPTAENFVPGLYYYDTTENDGDDTNANYARAFKDDKTYVDGVTSETPLYLVNLYEGNLIEAFEVLASRLQMEKATDIVAAFSASVPENSLIDKILGDRLIGELASISTDDILLSDIIESTEENQELRTIISSWMGKAWEEVTLTNLTDGSKPFTDIKISAIIDKDSEETNQQLVEIIDSMIDDTPWDDITLGQLMSSDYSTDNIRLSIFLKKETIIYDTGDLTVSVALTESDETIDVSAIDNTTETEIEGGEFTHTEKETSETAEIPWYCGTWTGTLGESALTLVINSDGTVSHNGTTSTYEVDGADTNQEIVGVIESMVFDKPYDEVTLGDLTSDKYTFGNVKISSIMPKGDVQPTMVKMLEDVTRVPWEQITVTSLSDAKIDYLRISAIIDYDETNPNPIYDVLLDLVNTDQRVVTWDTLTIADLNSIDSFDGLHLIKVMTDESNAMYDVLTDLTGKSAAEITIGDLNGIQNFDGLKLASVIDSKNIMFDILLDLVGGDVTADTLTVGDLNGITNFSGLHLTKIIPYSESTTDEQGNTVAGQNEALYGILCDITDETSPENITVGSLETLDSDSFGKIYLHRVLPVPTEENPANETLYSVLTQAITPTKAPEEIRVSDLNNLSFSSVTLTTLLPYVETTYDADGNVVTEGQNETLYDILSQATNTQPDQITIDSLSDISFDNVTLMTLIPYEETTYDENGNVVKEGQNESLYNILEDMTGVDKKLLTVQDLSKANVGNIKIFDAIDPESETVTSSSFLTALYKYNRDVTVANIGVALNNLPLADVYGEVCWTQTRSLAANGDVYTHDTTTVSVTNSDGTITTKDADRYTYAYKTSDRDLSGNEYFISAEAGCWLIFCNNITYDTDTTHPTGVTYTNTGRPITLIEDPHTTLAALENDSKNIANKISHATIFTLILTRLMEPNESYSTTLLSYTIQKMVDALNNPLIGL